VALMQRGVQNTVSKLVLGLNTDHGDSAAALIGEQGPIAAIAEERINRKKHCADFPSAAIREVLRIGGVSASDLTAVAVARNPRANLLGKLRFVAQDPLRRVALVRQRLAVHGGVQGTLERVASAAGVAPSSLGARLYQVEHHLAHAASAYYWSPFERAAALTVDGAGDFATAMWASCVGKHIRVQQRSLWPHSLGVFYTAICQYIGFDRYGEEFKVMGLSAYGKPSFMPLMRKLVHFDAAIGVRLDLSYFRHHRGEELESISDGIVTLPALYGPKLEAELGPARDRSRALTDREYDMAASMQLRYEEVFLQMVEHAVRVSGSRNLVLAGGCALNSVANGRMITEGYVERVYVHPAATDDGTAVGAAHYVLHQRLGAKRVYGVGTAYLGPEFSDAEIEVSLRANGRSFERLSNVELIDRAARAMQTGKILGWFQGREEWGPRALGNRSILCNPAWPGMKATLNARIKNREPFRPFAPVVRMQDLPRVFEGEHEVPFMVIVYKVRQEWRERIPAVTHEDNTGRVQTVERAQNPLYYDLITRFEDLTGVPVVLNTSFNENEPIVHQPAEAIACFERTQMDALAIGPFWLEK
jgi:carbamoyltransferase